jgi:hypothetical protein
MHALELPSVFTELGDLACTVPLIIPTIRGHYRSCLSLVVGYGLPADLALGHDWIDACIYGGPACHTVSLLIIA